MGWGLIAAQVKVQTTIKLQNKTMGTIDLQYFHSLILIVERIFVFFILTLNVDPRPGFEDA